MGSLRVRHNWVASLSPFTFMHWRRKWQPIPVILLWKIPRTRKPGGLPSMGSHRVGQDWSDLAAACCPLRFQGTTDSPVRVFPDVWKLLFFKTPFPRWISVPTSFTSFLSFIFFPTSFRRQWADFLGACCPLPAFGSCFVEFNQRSNVLLMNLWGRKWSPCPIPPPS